MRQQTKAWSGTTTSHGQAKAHRHSKKMTPINYGFFLLSRRDYSMHELRLKFEQHYADDEIPQATIDDVFERLVEYGYLDDQRFVEGFVRREVAKLQGAIKIRWALQRKGVSPDLIEQAFADVDWYALCLQALESRLHRLTLEQPKKIVRFLAGRGFSSDQIQSSIQALKQEL